MLARHVIGPFAATLAWASPGGAHDLWADGGAVPAWVEAQCCGVADAHHLGPEQVHHVDGGYRVDGYPGLIPDERLLPSQDGDWWVFYRDGGGGRFSEVYCFFGPLGF